MLNKQELSITHEIIDTLEQFVYLIEDEQERRDLIQKIDNMQDRINSEIQVADQKIDPEEFYCCADTDCEGSMGRDAWTDPVTGEVLSEFDHIQCTDCGKTDYLIKRYDEEEELTGSLST